MNETESNLTNKLLTLSKEKLFNMVYRDKNRFHVCYRNIAVSRVEELEKQKTELIELLKDVNHVLNDGRDVTSNNFYHNKINELLKKYSPS